MMTDETKDTPTDRGSESGGEKSPDNPKNKTPRAEASDKGETPAPPKVEPVSATPAPPGAAAGEKPAPPKAAPAAGHKPAPPPRKGPTITVDITGDALIDRIRQRFGDAITEAVATLGQQNIRVKKDSLVELCRFLHDDEEALFDMCTDVTAVH